ncbi:alpha-amylase family glycosyl hydrolase [Duganella radicis]|uniref:alpha-amylase family glycosyl hydrolase n=1 Tax=Duganella radicis TaxID=551988 RepID=UPI001478E757|nr:alpha-amylase family glycosyl hydrolase [Duganella radicis]
MTPEQDQGFAENPIVYFLMTDRFHASGPSGMGSYGRLNEPGGMGTFHGGNFAGISEKLRAGWFNELGVNAIWISAPYEQIHGWVPGAAGFRHEAYHGYWPLDYTCVDANFGDRASFREMVSEAHARGIAIVLDVVLGHVGYPDLNTLSQFLPATVQPHAGTVEVENYQAGYNLDAPQLLDWWGPAWVRASLPGYQSGGDDELTRLMLGLPRLLSECDNHVALPAFLRTKPDTGAVDLPATTVAGYVIGWLCQWVREFGVDGFRCDSARHVGLRTWQRLKSQARAAWRQWREETGRGDANQQFWMLGEVFGHGLERSAYFDHGFDSVLNFSFQHELKDIAQAADLASAFGRSLAWMRLDRLYARYAQALGGREHDVLSYLSSHDTELFPRPWLHFGATALMLLPGGVQIFYGDETARPPSAHAAADPVQATRSDMNWSAPDVALLRHWQLLGCFRRRHIAIARGNHRRISADPYVFVRADARSGDVVMIVIGPGQVRLRVVDDFGPVPGLRDAYTGTTCEVVDGCVELTVATLALLERT